MNKPENTPIDGKTQGWKPPEGSVGEFTIENIRKWAEYIDSPEYQAKCDKEQAELAAFFAPGGPFEQNGFKYPKLDASAYQGEVYQGNFGKDSDYKIRRDENGDIEPCAFCSLDLPTLALRMQSDQGSKIFHFCQLCANTNADGSVRYHQHLPQQKDIQKSVHIAGNMILQRIAEASARVESAFKSIDSTVGKILNHSLSGDTVDEPNPNSIDNPTQPQMVKGKQYPVSGDFLQELRDAGGVGWDSVDDVDAELDAIRGREPIERAEVSFNSEFGWHSSWPDLWDQAKNYLESDLGVTVASSIIQRFCFRMNQIATHVVGLDNDDWAEISKQKLRKLCEIDSAEAAALPCRVPAGKLDDGSTVYMGERLAFPPVEHLGDDIYSHTRDQTWIAAIGAVQQIKIVDGLAAVVGFRSGFDGMVRWEDGE